jgi:lactate racemase
MKYRFPYDWLPPLDIPDENLLGVYQARGVASSDAEEDIIRQGFEQPIGSARIRELAQGKKRALILSDDNSRKTPIHRVAPCVLNELREAGIKKDNIKFLIALGTHRDMTLDELAEKLGRDILENYEVSNHHSHIPDELARVGQTLCGTEVWVNKALQDADLIIGLGGIVPHPAAGFSGGGKIVAPGVCNPTTTGLFHWQSVSYPQKAILGKRDNPIREMIDEIARKAGLDVIVNIVQDTEDRIVKVVVGDPVKAHRVGCECALGIFGVKVPGNADIIIADSFPADIEMWQAVKGLCALEVMAPDGSILIYVSPCPEGMSIKHPAMSRYGFQTYEGAKRLLDAGKIHMVVAHQMVQVGRLLQRTRCFLISSGITDRGEIERVGFQYASNAQQALEKAFEAKGRDARVAILRHASEIIPIVEEQQGKVS